MNFLDAIYPIGLPIAMSLTGYNAFLTGLIVLVKRKDKAGCFYFLSSFMIFLWGVGTSFQLNNLLPIATSESWTRFSQLAALFIPCTWLHFVLVYTNCMRKFKLTLFFFYAVMIFILPFSFTPYYVAGFRYMVGVEHYPIPGPLYYLHFGSFCLSVSLSFFIFYKAIRNEKIKEKKLDLKLVCFSSLYGFIMGGLSFLPVFGVSFPQYNLLAMPMWQILLAIAMTRYRAFDLVELAEAAQRDKLAAIGTLAASMNHEIKNPLFIIRGLAEAQLSRSEEPGYKDASEIIEKSNDSLRRIHEQVVRAMDIMRRFSSFAKPSSTFDSRETVSLKQLLDGIIPLIQHDLELKNIKLILNISEHFQALRLNRRDAEEIFFNLIVNAVQAIKNKMQDDGCKMTDSRCETQDLNACNQSPETGTLKPESCNLPPESCDLKLDTITLTAKREKEHVIIEVSDNGPGIPEKKLKQIFDPFYTTKTEGTGLGLYITRQLVERNGGKIAVKSKLGCGTLFKLRFPCVEQVFQPSLVKKPCLSSPNLLIGDPVS